MANLAQSAVTSGGYYYNGDYVGSKRKVVPVTLVLTGQGGGTNLIPASLFGLREITEARGFRDSANKFYPAVPSFDGASLIFGTGTAGAAADVTATVKGVVAGLE